MSAWGGVNAAAVLVPSASWAASRPLYWPAGGLATGAVAVGGFQSHQPIADPAVVHAGTSAGRYSADLYDRVHLLPGRADLGFIASDRVWPFAVWNAWRQPATLDTLTVNNVDGVSCSAPLAAAWGGLEERRYALSVAADGLPQLSGWLGFGFSRGGVVVLPVSAIRCRAFSLQPDWAAGVVERLEWLTDVLASHNGVEQRVALRAAPRRALQADLLLTGDDLAVLDSQSYADTTAPLALPIWHEGAALTAAVLAGGSALALETAHRRFTAGSLLWLTDGTARGELLTIDAVDAATITLAQPVTRSWPAGALAYPARLARLSTLSGAVACPGVTGDQVMFSLTEAEAPPVAGLPTFEDCPVLDLETAGGETSYGHERSLTQADNSTAAIWQRDRAGVAQIVRQHRLQWVSRAEGAERLAALAALSGRCKGFWWPVAEARLSAVGEQPAGSNQLRVTPCGYAARLFAKANRQVLALRHREQGWYFRRVIDAVDDVDSERLTLAEALPVAHAAAAWAFIGFLEKTRLDSDALEIHWQTPEVGSVQFSTRSLVA